LSLLRHVKSSWSDARLKDIERPLSVRGEKAAPRMGAFMARQGLAPDLILCSPSVRTRETLDLVLPRLKAAPEVVYEDALYLANPATMLKRLRKVAASVRHTMIIGHNPGLQSLGQQLAGAGAEEDLGALAEKLPTGGLVVMTFDVPSWAKVK